MIDIERRISLRMQPPTTTKPQKSREFIESFPTSLQISFSTFLVAGSVSPLGLVSRRVHLQWSAIELGSIEGLDGLVALALGGEFHEPESSGASGVPVEHDSGLLDGPVLPEELVESGVVHSPREVSHEQLRLGVVGARGEVGPALSGGGALASVSAVVRASLARLREADPDDSAVELGAFQGVDGLLGLVHRAHGHEGEASALLRVSVVDHFHQLHIAHLLENLRQLLAVNAPRQVPDVQLRGGGHGSGGLLEVGGSGDDSHLPPCLGAQRQARESRSVESAGAAGAEAWRSQARTSGLLGSRGLDRPRSHDGGHRGQRSGDARGGHREIADLEGEGVRERIELGLEPRMPRSREREA
ncbi:hypothetical protein Mapa_007171 [Marchantia paleacea]|nr:hypothetical protein Mapa_007171 [Marchantia paleacea]